MRAALASGVAIACAAGCAVSEPATTIDDRVVTLAGDVIADATTVSVPAAGNDGIAPGTIVIAPSGDGLLRGVAAVRASGDRLILDTIPATLDDAVIDGAITDTLALNDGKADTYGLGRIAFDTANRQVLSNQYLTVKVDRATFVATPTIDLDLTMRDRALDHFAAVLHGTLDATLDLELAATTGVVHPAIPLWSSPPQLFVQWVGYVPVVEAVTLSVGLRLDTTATGNASVHLKGSAHLALDGGVTYDAGAGFAPVASFEHELSGSAATGTHLDSLTVRAYLYTQVDVKFYGLAGPFINAGPYVDTNDRVGVYAEVGGSINAFGLHLPAMPRFALYDRSAPL